MARYFLILILFFVPSTERYIKIPSTTSYGSWTCTECWYANGTTEDDILNYVSDEEAAKLSCLSCGETLNDQLCFNKYDNNWICTECGARLHHDYSDNPYSVVDDEENDYEIEVLGKLSSILIQNIRMILEFWLNIMR